VSFDYSEDQEVIEEEKEDLCLKFPPLEFGGIAQ
jgi:hypothetical protein